MNKYLILLMSHEIFYSKNETFAFCWIREVTSDRKMFFLGVMNKFIR